MGEEKDHSTGKKQGSARSPRPESVSPSTKSYRRQILSSGSVVGIRHPPAPLAALPRSCGEPVPGSELPEPVPPWLAKTRLAATRGPTFHGPAGPACSAAAGEGASATDGDGIRGDGSRLRRMCGGRSGASPRWTARTDRRFSKDTVS
ncbi:hypothetical protein THAOC_08904, partial [Thalassiosira oceanica]